MSQRRRCEFHRVVAFRGGLGAATRPAPHDELRCIADLFVTCAWALAADRSGTLLALRPTATRRSMTKQTIRRQPSLEQRAVEQFRVLAKPHRLRVLLDGDDFPIIPGRYGQIEWFDGFDLAVYTARPRVFARIWGIPGVRRHQTGDTEMRAVFPPERLASVATVIRARRRRTQVAPRSLGNLRPRATSAPADDTSGRPQDYDSPDGNAGPGE